MNDYQKLYISNQDTFLAYQKYQAKQTNKYGLIFLGGFKSDMNGTKAKAISEYAEENDYDFIRFDYFGHGQSSGNFIDGTIGTWLNNTLEIIDNLTDNKPQILIGSSMGGWIMLLSALARPKKIAKLIGLAAAPDFTENLIWNHLSNAQKELIEKDGEFFFSNEFCEDAYPISFNLIKDGRKNLLLNHKIALDIPIHLIHGMNDKDVPYNTSIKIAEQVISTKVEIQLLKQSGHRLSSAGELEVIYQAITKFISE